MILGGRVSTGVFGERVGYVCVGWGLELGFGS